MEIIYKLIAVVALATTIPLWAQRPFIGSARNAASYAGGVAQGSIFVVFGINMGPEQLQTTGGYPLPATLQGTSIQVTSGGITLDALPLYTSNRQLAALLPSRTPEGLASFTVSYNGQTSTPANLRVVRSFFGVFSTSESGRGIGAIQNIAAANTPTQNVLLAPAHIGQTLVLYGTGLGPVSGDEAAGALPGPLADVTTEVYVGGRPAQVLYAGRSGCCSGLDQINFIVPEGAEGCYLPVQVRTNSTLSNTTTISVAAPGAAACASPHGRTEQELLTAQQQGSLAEGNIVLLKEDSTIVLPGVGFPFRILSDKAFANFDHYPLADLLRSSGATSSGPAVALGSCSTYLSSGTYAANPVDVVRPPTLDAGPSLTLRGPNGERTVGKGLRNDYEAELSTGNRVLTVPYLVPGNYTISNNSGGGNVGAFTAQLRIPASLRWTNEAAVDVVTRSQGQEITWSGADPNGYVFIWGRIGLTEGAAFACFERGDVGRFTIPNYILQTLPVPASAGAEIGSLGVGIGTAATRFSTTGLDAGRVNYVSVTDKTVTYR